MWWLIGISIFMTIVGGLFQLAEMRRVDRDIEGLRYQQDELLKAATHPATGHLYDHLREP